MIIENGYMTEDVVIIFDNAAEMVVLTEVRR